MNRKYYLTVFILFLLNTASFADIFYHFRWNLKYTYNAGADTAMVLKLRFLDGYFREVKRDSIVFSGQQQWVKNYQVPDSQRFYLVEAVFWRTDGWRLNGKLFGGNIFSSPDCSGTALSNPFSGDALGCHDFTSQNSGLACVSLELSFFQENQDDKIRVKPGTQRWMNRYCASDVPVLESPCYFSYRSAGSRVQWECASSPAGPWYPAGKGKQLPLSWRDAVPGSDTFLSQRYYRAGSDSSLLKDCSGGCASPVFGPLVFYPDRRISGLRTEAADCITGRGAVLFDTDSLVHLRDGSALLFIYRKDTSGNWIMHGAGDSRSGITKLTEFYTLPPNPLPAGWHPDTLYFAPGQYRIRAKWFGGMGLPCADHTEDFRIDTALIPRIDSLRSIATSCPAAKDGSILFSARGGTAPYSWSSDGIAYQVSAQIQNLDSGVHRFFFRDSRGCPVLKHDSIRTYVPAGKPWIWSAPEDTTLCEKQQFSVQLNYPGVSEWTWRSDTGWQKVTDSALISRAGKYVFAGSNAAGCRLADSMQVKKRNLEVVHDFLVPTQVFVRDTAVAVDHSQPEGERLTWSFSDPGIVALYPDAKNHSVKMEFPDTGKYRVTLFSRYGECGFRQTKTVTVLGGKDSIKTLPGMGYRGPLIQEFYVSPNPSNGVFKIHVKLRDTADIVIYKIDPVSADITGDIDKKGKKYYEFNAFQGYFSEVFFLKLMAGNESKTIKVVIIQDY